MFTNQSVITIIHALLILYMYILDDTVFWTLRYLQTLVGLSTWALYSPELVHIQKQKIIMLKKLQ